ncbi:MAG: (d)CMP kinase [Candidatus Omnitrophica bacterium]|nr:(d)CMP kinase [Candidatus Omnitrophota bacterium]
MIIAIDGPAGAGKSTVAKLLAQRLGFLYMDTGAMYRAITLRVLEENINLEDTQKIIGIARKVNLELKNCENGNLHVYLDKRDVTEEIRKPKITQFVSEVSKIKEVREVALEIQRSLAKDRDCVVEGRDIGTVVFPNAEKKFFLDAEFSERVRRRYKELKEKNESITLEEIEEDLKKRDLIDSTREIAPLKKARDAVYIDTTNLSIQEVVDKILRYL